MKTVEEKTCSKCGLTKPSKEFRETGYHCVVCRSQYNRIYHYKNWNARLFEHALQTTRKKSLNIDITPEYILDLLDLQNGLCYWFKVPLIISIDKNPQQPTLDRLEPEKGYVKGNVVLACFVANFGRNTFSCEKFNNFIDTLKSCIRMPLSDTPLELDPVLIDVG